MTELCLNPPNCREELHQRLIESYPGWGCEETTHWHVARAVDGRQPDVLVLRSDGRLVAGILIHYRKVLLPGRGQTECGILAATWTAPEARGQGLYSRLTEEVDRVGTERGVAFFTSFSVAANSSGQKLVRSGAGAVPFEYWLFEGASRSRDTSGVWHERPCDEETLDRLWRDHQATTGQPHFRYVQKSSFRSQMLERPLPTSLFETRAGSLAVVEHSRHTDRIQLVCGRPEDGPSPGLDLASERLRAGRKVFHMTAPGETTERDEEVGSPALRPSRRIPGLITLKALPTEETKRLFEGVVPTGAELAEPTSPHYLGSWSFSSGDRM